MNLTWKKNLRTHLYIINLKTVETVENATRYKNIKTLQINVLLTVRPQSGPRQNITSSTISSLQFRKYQLHIKEHLVIELFINHHSYHDTEHTGLLYQKRKNTKFKDKRGLTNSITVQIHWIQESKAVSCCLSPRRLLSNAVIKIKCWESLKC